MHKLKTILLCNLYRIAGAAAAGRKAYILSLICSLNACAYVYGGDFIRIIMCVRHMKRKADFDDLEGSDLFKTCSDLGSWNRSPVPQRKSIYIYYILYINACICVYGGENCVYYYVRETKNEKGQNRRLV